MCRKIVVSVLRRSLAVLVLAVAVACGSASSADAPSKLHIGVHAAFVVSGGGSVWATDPVTNAVVRIDPAAVRVKAKLGAPGYPLGLAFGSGSVWVGSRYADRVTRFSARTNKRQARIRVGSGPYAVAYGAGAVWVTNENVGSVSRIGPKRNKVVKTIRVGGRPNGVTVAFGSVWVARLRAGPSDPHRPRAEQGHRQRRHSDRRLDHASRGLALGLERDRQGLPARPGHAGSDCDGRPSVPTRSGARRSPAGSGCRTSTRTRSRWSIPPPTRCCGRSMSGRARSRSPKRAGAAWVSSEDDGDLWRLSSSG